MTMLRQNQPQELVQLTLQTSKPRTFNSKGDYENICPNNPHHVASVDWPSIHVFIFFHHLGLQFLLSPAYLPMSVHV